MASSSHARDTKGEPPTRSTGLPTAGKSSAARSAVERRASRTPAARIGVQFVDEGLGPMPPPGSDEGADLEERARTEKAAALEQLFRSRLSVLIGPAGTGKTTLLRMLCSLPDVALKGLLLLAPTGKARVRLEERTGLRGSGRTLAQFLNRLQRYDGADRRLFPESEGPTLRRLPHGDRGRVLHADRGAAGGTFDSLTNVERLCWSAILASCRPSGQAGRSSIS